MTVGITQTEVTCKRCGTKISKTHQMQTLSAQLQYHLRGTHKLTISQAKVESFRY